MPALRSILHVDLDAFFVAVERLRDPSLVGKPVVVGADPQGGKGRGVVAAASYEARAFGVHSAMPISEAWRLCPHAVYLSGRHTDYARHARAVRRLFRKVTPAVEPISIDEAYLDLTGTERLHGAPATTADRLRRRIFDETGLSASMGLASSKVVAKIASELAKPAGFLWVWPAREAALLAPLPIERMPGIGPATRARLLEFNVRTLGDLARIDPPYLEAAFGEGGPLLHARARGADSVRYAGATAGSAVAARERPKSISRETTFDENTTDLERCEAVLFHLAEHAARDLRGNRLTARTVVVKLRYRDFTTITRRTTLATPTDSDRVIAAAARELFRAAYARRVAVRLLGVGLTNLVDAAPQLDLFAEPRALAWERLITALDRLRGRWGFESVRTGPTLLLPVDEDRAAWMASSFVANREAARQDAEEERGAPARPGAHGR
ncbi:MAG: DNA polymerase IV [Gemmatimonadota bacterium]